VLPIALKIATAAMCRIDTLIVGLPELSKPIPQIRRQLLYRPVNHSFSRLGGKAWHVVCGCRPEVQKSGLQGQTTCNTELYTPKVVRF
jgi:hypothetical protein